MIMSRLLLALLVLASCGPPTAPCAPQPPSVPPPVAPAAAAAPPPATQQAGDKLAVLPLDEADLFREERAGLRVQLARRLAVLMPHRAVLPLAEVDRALRPVSKDGTRCAYESAPLPRRAATRGWLWTSTSTVVGEQGKSTELWVEIHGGREEQVVAESQQQPAALALDDDHVYWSNLGSGMSKDGTIVKMPKDGGPITVLAEGQQLPWQMALYGSQVFWTNMFEGAPIMAAPKDGSEPAHVIWSGDQSARGIAVDSTGVYWADFDAATINHCPLTGCSQPPETIAAQQLTALAVALDDAWVYWARNGGGIFRAGKAIQGEAHELYPGTLGGIQGLLLDGHALFWLEGDTVQTMPTSGGAPSTTVGGGGWALAGLAVNGDCMFFLDQREHTFYAIAKPSP